MAQSLLDPIPNAAPLSERERMAMLIVAWDAPWATSFRYAPYHPDALIAGKGYDTLDDMLTLSAYSAAFTIMVDAVLAKHWQVKPPPKIKKDSPDYEKATKICEAADWHLHNIQDVGDNPQNLTDVIEEILLAVHHGFSILEMEWRLVEDGPEFVKNQYGWKRFSYKRCKQIGFQVDANLAVRALTNNVAMAGYKGPYQMPLPVEKVLRYVFRPINSHPYGRGIARETYKHYWMLDSLYKMWTIALEIHGIPHYRVSGPVSNKNEADMVRDSYAKIRTGAPFVAPEGWTVELDQIANGTLDAFKTAISHHSECIFLSYLGQTLTTQQGAEKGTYAQAAVHQETQELIFKRIRRDLEWVITEQALKRWTRYNYGADAVHLTPVFDLGDWDSKERKMLSDSFAAMLTQGVLYPGEPFIRELMGYPPADKETEEKLEKSRQLEQKMLQLKQQQSTSSDDPGGGDRGGETD